MKNWLAVIGLLAHLTLVHAASAVELLPAQLHPDIVTNVDIANGTHYIMMRVTFFVATSRQQQQVLMFAPQIKSEVIELLNEKPLSALTTATGKSQLQQEIMMLANEILQNETNSKPIKNIHLGNYKIE